MESRPPAAVRVAPLGADLLCVLGFALGGRSAHDSGDLVSAVVTIAWPFALGVALAHGWLTLRGRWAGRVWPSGVIVLVSTYGVGMLLRLATDRGTAPAFLVVAAGFLALTMLGWRLVAQRVGSRRTRAGG